MLTANVNNEIILLKPAFSHNIWGGNSLAKEYGYEIEGDDIGECWGISAYPEYESILQNTDCKGKTLTEVWKEYPECFGNIGVEKFPLLVKIIDAKDKLSIQVHPDDAYANINENGSLGKTECWYILDCPEKDAKLVIGHNARTKEELSQMIDDKLWGELIREVPVKKGDFIQIDPGTVHAIKGGFRILETQQSSDLTYRLYDYDRLSNGKPRELHLAKSIDVIQVPAKEMKDSISETSNTLVNVLQTLIANQYYTVYKLIMKEQCRFERKGPFMLCTVIEGNGKLNGVELVKGQHFIVPNGVEKLDLSGDMELIFSTI